MASKPPGSATTGSATTGSATNWGEASSSVSEGDEIAALIEAGAFDRAIAAAVDVHGAAIGRFCMALLKSQADAEDVAQETFVAAHAAFASYRGEGSIRAFLFTIARRRCAKRVAKAVRRDARLHLIKDTARELAQAGGTDRDVEAWMQKKELAKQMRETLNALKPTDREILLLRYDSDLSYREIAAVFEVDEATARKRVSRALNKLRAQYFSENSDVERRS